TGLAGDARRDGRRGPHPVPAARAVPSARPAGTRLLVVRVALPRGRLRRPGPQHHQRRGPAGGRTHPRGAGPGRPAAAASPQTGPVGRAPPTEHTPPHPRTAAPPHRRTAAPPHRRTAAPPHGRTRRDAMTVAVVLYTSDL